MNPKLKLSAPKIPTKESGGFGIDWEFFQNYS